MFFLLLLLPSLVSRDIVIALDKKQLAMDSIVRIQHVSDHMGRFGSGMYVSVGDKYFVLTNAHICMPDVTPSNFTNKSKIKFVLNSKYEVRTVYDYDIHNLKLNPTMDVCLIPLAIKPVISYSLLNYETIVPEKVNSKVGVEFYNVFYDFMYLSHNGTVEEKPRSTWNYVYDVQSNIKWSARNVKFDLITMTTNHRRQGTEVYIAPYLARFVNTEFNGTAGGHTKKCIHPESYASEFVTKPGDSGSPVFNTNYDLVGVIFANAYNKDEDTQKEIYAGMMVSVSSVLALVSKEISEYYKNKPLAN